MRNKDRLVLDEYVDECDDLGIGETRRFDHDDNEGCGDTRGRLYITRSVMDPDTLLGFCQNCQKGNAVGLFDGYRENLATKCTNLFHNKNNGIDDALDCDSSCFYSDNIEDHSFSLWDLPIHAKAWCYMRGVSDNMIDDLKWFYEPSLDRIVQPVFKHIFMNSVGESGREEFIGEQARLLRGKGPKYITSKINKDIELYSVLDNTHIAKKLMIVEDMQSAYHVWRCTEYTVLCNFGVQVRPNVLHSVIQEYKPQKIVVWLDNDNDIVREQAETMKRTISLLAATGTDVSIVRETKDPKELPPTNLREVLNNG